MPSSSPARLLAGLAFAGGEQCPCLVMRQFEAALEHLFDDRPFPFVEMIVAVGCLDKQRSQGELQSVLWPP